MFFYLNLEVFILNLVHDALLRKILLRHPEGQLPSAKFVYGHSHTPHVATTDLFHLHALQYFGSHVLRCPSEGDTLVRIDYLRGQAEISYLDLFVLDQDVGWLDISVHKIFRCKIVAC